VKLETDLGRKRLEEKMSFKTRMVEGGRGKMAQCFVFITELLLVLSVFNCFYYSSTAETTTFERIDRCGNYEDWLRNNNIHHTKWVSSSHMFRCTFFTKLFLGHITYLKYEHFFPLTLTCLSVAESKYT